MPASHEPPSIACRYSGVVASPSEAATLRAISARPDELDFAVEHAPDDRGIRVADPDEDPRFGTIERRQSVEGEERDGSDERRDDEKLGKRPRDRRQQRARVGFGAGHACAARARHRRVSGLVRRDHPVDMVISRLTRPASDRKPFINLRRSGRILSRRGQYAASALPHINHKPPIVRPRPPRQAVPSFRRSGR